MRQLCDAIDRLNDWVGRLAALLILPSLLITMIEVVARYAFNSQTVWVNESVQILFGFYFLLGGVLFTAVARAPGAGARARS